MCRGPCTYPYRFPKLHKYNVWAEDLAYIHTGSLIVASVSGSPCEHCLIYPVSHFLWYPWPLWLLHSFLLCFCGIFWALLNIWLWVSASAPIACRMKSLWWLLGSISVYDYSRVSLGIILLPFWGRVVLSLGYPASGSWPFKYFRYGLSLLVWDSSWNSN